MATKAKTQKTAAQRKADTDSRITFRLDPGLKKSLEALAKADRRSLSDYLYIELEKLVAAQTASGGRSR